MSACIQTCQHNFSYSYSVFTMKLHSIYGYGWIYGCAFAKWSWSRVCQKFQSYKSLVSAAPTFFKLLWCYFLPFVVSTCRCAYCNMVIFHDLIGLWIFVIIQPCTRLFSTFPPTVFKVSSWNLSAIIVNTFRRSWCNFTAFMVTTCKCAYYKLVMIQPFKQEL